MSYILFIFWGGPNSFLLLSSYWVMKESLKFEVTLYWCIYRCLLFHVWWKRKGEVIWEVRYCERGWWSYWSSLFFFLLSKLSLYFERFWATLTLAPFTFISNSIYLALCQRQTVAKLIEKVPISSRTNTNKPEVVFCYCQTTAFLEWFYSRIISYTIACSNQTPWLCSSHCVYLEGVTRFWRSWDITVKPTWLI